MDMNDNDYIMTLPKRGLKTRSYNMDMNKEDHITTLPKRGFKTRSYKMDMVKKDLKKLTKGQLIKLLMNQQKNEEVKSIKKPAQPSRTGKWESVKPRSVLRKSVNEDLMLSPPEQFQDGYKSIPKPNIDMSLQKQNARRPPKPSREPPLPPTPKHEFNFDDDIFQTEKSKALKNSKSSGYKAGKIRNSKATQINSKLKSLKNWTMLKRYITYSKN